MISRRVKRRANFGINAGRWQGTDVTETALASFFGRAVSATRKADFLNVLLWQIEAVSQSVARIGSGAS